MLHHSFIVSFLLAAVLCVVSPAHSDSTNSWPNWQKYRTTVQAPAPNNPAGIRF